MNIFRQLTEKPWENEGNSVASYRDGNSFAATRGRIGLTMFLAVVSILFFLLVIAYGSRMVVEDWRPAPRIVLLWQNTFLLILSSIGMQWGRVAARRGNTNSALNGLLAGGVFAVAFLIGQAMAWSQLRAMTYLEPTNPAVAFFYLITGLHALHLAGGMIAWVLATYRVWTGGPEIARSRRMVELCTAYWHYLLAVWLILFGLLFSGNNLDAFLALCGLK